MNSRSTNPTVLHVDDDESVLDITTSALGHEYPDIALLQYDDPDEALAALAAVDVDCIVSDSIRLADGTPFVRGVRDLDPSTPIVLFTGSTWDEIRDVAEAADAAGYVHKGSPDAVTALGRRVQTLVREAGGLERPDTLDGGWTVVGYHDWGDDVELSSRLVEVVTAHTGLDAESADPLFDTVDTDAVTTLLAPRPGGPTPDGPLAVQFQWLDHDLQVTRAGRIALRPLAERVAERRN